jgi:hypothetical protein
MNAGEPFATVGVDRLTSPAKLAELATFSHQLDGSQPYVRVIRVDSSCPPVALLPDEAHVRRCVTSDTAVTVVATLEDATLLIETWPRTTTIHVAAATNEYASRLADEMRGRIPAASSDDVRVRVWHHNCGSGSSSHDRTIEAPCWDGISHNYPRVSREPLAELMAICRPTGTGKLILWHGDPGTGKTTALRALMRSWRSWCQPQYIADPEKFFAEPAYMTSVLTTAPVAEVGPTLDRVAQPEAVWRLIVAEDSDEYLRTSARRDAGAALGRVLNLADGILGQGMNVLVLLTTNEATSRLHPAIVRPGRCMAAIEFSAFDERSASRWLGRPVSRPMTLAELLEARGDLTRVATPGEEHPVGQYL